MPKRSKSTCKTGKDPSAVKAQEGRSRLRRWLAKRIIGRARSRNGQATVADGARSGNGQATVADDPKLTTVVDAASGDNGSADTQAHQKTTTIQVTSVQTQKTLRTNALCGFKDLTRSSIAPAKRGTPGKFADWSSEFRGYYSYSRSPREHGVDTAVLVTYHQAAAAATADYASSPQKFNLEAAIRPYHIRELLGVGGQGVVFGVTKAGKEFVAKFAARSADIKLIMNEYILMKGLKHPNIMRVLGPIKGGFVMERAHIDLTSVLKYNNPNSDLKLRIVSGVITGLGYLHSRAIAHLDVKPGNILLDKWGKPKITDFGLSTRFRAPTGEQLELESFLGSTPYMAPELLRFEPDSSRGMLMPPLDIWACGCLVYRIVATQRPFGTDDSIKAIQASQKVMAAHGLTVPLKVAAQIRNDAKTSLLFTVAQKMLQILPSQRPTAAGLLASYFGRKHIRRM